MFSFKCAMETMMMNLQRYLNQDVDWCLAWCASCWTWQPQDIFSRVFGMFGTFPKHSKKHCDTISDFCDLNHHLSAVQIKSVGFLTFFQPENIFHPISGSSENLSSSKMPIGYRGYVNCQADKSCQDDSFLLWNCWNSWGLQMIITSRPASSFLTKNSIHAF